jgi:hypothetical protein
VGSGRLNNMNKKYKNIVKHLNSKKIKNVFDLDRFCGRQNLKTRRARKKIKECLEIRNQVEIEKEKIDRENYKVTGDVKAWYD